MSMKLEKPDDVFSFIRVVAQRTINEELGVNLTSNIDSLVKNDTGINASNIHLKINDFVISKIKENALSPEVRQALESNQSDPDRTIEKYDSEIGNVVDQKMAEITVAFGKARKRSSSAQENQLTSIDWSWLSSSVNYWVWGSKTN